MSTLRTFLWISWDAGGWCTDVRHSQIRQGIAGNTKGTAFVVYEDVMDAKQACDKLNGFNFQNRYLVGKYVWEVFRVHVATFSAIC